MKRYCVDAPTSRTWHEGGFQQLRRLFAPAIPLWSRYAIEQNGLSHDENVIDVSRLPKQELMNDYSYLHLCFWCRNGIVDMEKVV